MTATLDGLIEAAHRTSLRLLTLGGAASGLLIGLGVLLLLQGEPVAAAALWGVAAATGGALGLAGAYIRRSAAVTFQLGAELAHGAESIQHRDAANAHALGELRTQIALLQRTVNGLEASRPDATSGSARVPEPSEALPDEDSYTGTVLLEELDRDTLP